MANENSLLGPVTTEAFEKRVQWEPNTLGHTISEKNLLRVE